MKLTVIVTVYNIAEYLPRFFASMKAQTFTDYTLLMIDDGSEDDGLKICRQYADEDSRIQVVAFEHIGISAARNRAMSYIETPFTAYADGDDYIEPDYLKHLMDAQEKHNADLAVSRVQYHLESGAVEGAFPSRGEQVIKGEDIRKTLPMLIDDRRLNYLYGKVYRSSLLRDIRVEDDVRQGSDTMINIQYIGKADTVVLIDDLDYHYIRYSSRSVTSYSGKDAYERICRINRFIYDCTEENGLMTDELLYVIDSRVLQSGVWVIDKIIASDSGGDEKARQIDAILNDPFYTASYERQRQRERGLDFDPIPPQDGGRYLAGRQKEKKRNTRKAAILKASPKFLKDAYHKIKGKE